MVWLPARDNYIKGHNGFPVRCVQWCPSLVSIKLAWIMQPQCNCMVIILRWSFGGSPTLLAQCGQNWPWSLSHPMMASAHDHSIGCHYLNQIDTNTNIHTHTNTTHKQNTHTLHTINTHKINYIWNKICLGKCYISTWSSETWFCFSPFWNRVNKIHTTVLIILPLKFKFIFWF